MPKPDQVVNPDDASTFFYQPGTYAPMDSAGFLMRRVLGSILQQADAQLAVHGLTYVQWLPLYKLLLCAETTSAQLAKDLGMDPASVTRALDRIEAKGLLRRERSTTDRRVVHLSLTDDGRRIAADVPQVLSRVLNLHLAGFTHDECTLLLNMLRRMLENGNAMRGDNAAPLACAGPDGNDN
ncbi:MarR family transcriptional regulator [Diaphorobacter sp.]|uniref:MarR family winged helix-turn-helix transcriptional regulator n=1 Tax=Diaphorobacter sp. TaxID=1934310 RepID=UPI0028A96706|nr:MarR family transcriptional regulator [Diaphorobacter sp.]